MPNPQWRIWVDWDADGVWSDPDKDLTADVMALHWSWGKPLSAANIAGRRPTRNSSNRLDRAGAAGLELTPPQPRWEIFTGQRGVNPG